MEFLIHHHGRPIGPYSESEVRNRLLSGAIDPSDLAWHEGASTWAPLSTFPQFASASRPTLPHPLSLSLHPLRPRPRLLRRPPSPSSIPNLSAPTPPQPCRRTNALCTKPRFTGSSLSCRFLPPSSRSS